MTTALLSSKAPKPVPPMKGSFPLDHENVCRRQMIFFMKCLKDHGFKNEECRLELKDYLQCRMDNNLMTKESWEDLGLKDVDDTNNSNSSSSA